jgi:glutaconate CoA-transferase subunit B
MSDAQNGAATREERMTVAAARQVKDRQVLLVGVGPPNAAANLARRLQAPEAVLIYESGAIEAKPVRLPLSIGDDDLAETAAELVSVPEMFNYWIGAGRIDIGFLGAAQLDRHANINTTVIGSCASRSAASSRSSTSRRRSASATGAARASGSGSPARGRR